MKLDSKTLTFINKTVEAAQLVGIDDIIIETGMVRAMNESSTIVILQSDGIPELPFAAIGLNRISTFQTRYEAAKSQDNFTIDVVTDDSSEFVRSLTLKGKGVKVDYRCANPSTIRAPKQLKDPDHHKLKLSGETVALFQKAMSAMGSEVVTLLINDGVSFEFQDDNMDSFKIDFESDVELLTEESTNKVAHKYPAKVLSALFRYNPSGTFTIGKAGTLSVMVNDLRVTVFPRI